MKYLLIICFFILFLQDTAKNDTIKTRSIDLQFAAIIKTENTIKKIDTLEIKLNKIIELLNDSTKIK